MAVFALLLLVIGLFHIFAPYAAWYISLGWKLRDAEPSDAYLTMSRIGGVIACIIAVIMLVSSIVHASGHAGADERLLRSTLENNRISYVTLQMKKLDPQPDLGEIAQWITDAKWKPAPDHYREEPAFASLGELDLHVADGSIIRVYKLRGNEFGIGNGRPAFVFSSRPLSDWFASQGY